MSVFVKLEFCAGEHETVFDMVHPERKKIRSETLAFIHNIRKLVFDQEKRSLLSLNIY